MKESFVCVKRASVTKNPNHDFREYHLKVMFHFADPVDDAQNLHFKIFSPSLDLCSTVFSRGGRPIRRRKMTFDATNVREWENMSYRIVVYMGNKAKWFGRFLICDGENSATLSDIDALDSGQDQFFVRQFYFRPCYFTLAQMNLEAGVADGVLDGLYQVSRKLSVLDEECDFMPKVVVKAPQSEVARKLAVEVVAMMVGDDITSNVFNTSLANLSTVADEWTCLSCATDEIRALAVSLEGIDDGWEALKQLRRLAKMADCLLNHAPVLILYGTPEQMFKAQKLYNEEGDLFKSDVKFCVPGVSVSSQDDALPEEVDEEDLHQDDKLQQLLDEFVNDSDTTPEPRPHQPSPLERFEQMVGLDRVKKEVSEARTMALFTQHRRALGLDASSENRNHMLFLGSPGTGKTTVARLIGEMYHEMGLLSKGHTVETSRTDLMGEYIGETEKKIRDDIERARGGVLFIDEAYTLVFGASDSKDYGRHVLDALLTVLSEPNPDMIVILAGYEDKMQALLRVNPGLHDRFPLKFHFDDYSSEQLYQMAVNLLMAQNYVLSDEAARMLRQTTDKAVRQRDRYFGNGRWVHNLVEHGIIKNMARRVMAAEPDTQDRQIFCRVEESDVVEAADRLLARSATPTPCRIGFTA